MNTWLTAAVYLSSSALLLSTLVSSSTTENIKDIPRSILATQDSLLCQVLRLCSTRRQRRCPHYFKTLLQPSGVSIYLAVLMNQVAEIVARELWSSTVFSQFPSCGYRSPATNKQNWSAMVRYTFKSIERNWQDSVEATKMIPSGNAFGISPAMNILYRYLDRSNNWSSHPHWEDLWRQL